MQKNCKIYLNQLRTNYEMEEQRPRQPVINEYFLIATECKHKVKYGKGLKILSPKQILQRFPMAQAQLKAGNAVSRKRKSKKVCNNIMNSIKL